MSFSPCWILVLLKASISLLIFWLTCYIPHVAVRTLWTIKSWCSACRNIAISIFSLSIINCYIFKDVYKGHGEEDWLPFNDCQERKRRRCLGSQTQVGFQVLTIVFFRLGRNLFYIWEICYSVERMTKQFLRTGSILKCLRPLSMGLN